MTVSYTQEVATCSGFGCFIKLLARWRGSIYKLIWQDLIVFLASFYCLSLTYRFLLNEHQKFVFECVVYYCYRNGSLIPLSFVLGFYVLLIMKRWWDQYLAIPWPDPLAVYVSALVRGQDDRGRLMRRTVMRYVCLTQAMVFSLIAPEVKKRFPTLDQLVDAGLLLDNEKKTLNALDEKFGNITKHWLPIVWAAMIVTRARKEGRIWDDFSLKTIIDELNKFRGKCNLLLHYDFISIPLVYTQVVALTVYTYFVSAVFGRQWTDKMDKNGYWTVIGYYFPVFATLEFFFYMGWMKVAESLINPFGPDDDDFEVVHLIDRNLQVSYLIVDDMHHAHPELVRDQYWDEVFPTSLPYPAEFSNERNEPPEQSTAKLAFATRISSAKIASEKSELSEQSSENLRMLQPSSSHHKIMTAFIRSSLSESSSIGDTSVTKIVKLSYDEQDTETAAKMLLPKKSLQITSESDLESDHDDDDFETLKAEREQQRLERLRLNMAHSLSKVAGVVADIMRPSVRNDDADTDADNEETDNENETQKEDGKE